jgi:phospholipid/cholesterol/gamma-HCH transport system substrate-binding protein
MMEIRARYVLIGLFVLVIAAAIAGFVYWLNNVGGVGDRTAYRIRFEGSVAGLSRGSIVQFNGINVGEVTRVTLIPDRPNDVMATIEVDVGTPVRADTLVGLYFRGLTGTAAVSLRGGVGGPPAPGPDGGPPVLVAGGAAIKDLTQSARDVLARIDAVVAENAESLRGAIAGIDDFATALSRNSDKVDGILTGLAGLTGGGQPKAPPVLYDLAPATGLTRLGALPEDQLAIPAPSVVVALDTQRILRQSEAGDSPAFEGSQWADNTPLLFQARVVQSFENAGYLRASAPVDGFTADRQLLIDLRRFRLADGPEGEVEFSARLVDGDGKVIDARVFSARAPATGTDVKAAVAAITAAFGKAATELVDWTLDALVAHQAASEPAEPAPTQAEPEPAQ